MCFVGTELLWERVGQKLPSIILGRVKPLLFKKQFREEGLVPAVVSGDPVHLGEEDVAEFTARKRIRNRVGWKCSNPALSTHFLQ